MFQVCGGKNPSLADRRELPFIEAIITEGLRLGTPAGLTGPHRPLKVNFQMLKMKKKQQIYGYCLVLNKNV